MTEIRDFMTKENLEMIGLAVMCDRFSHLYKSDRKYDFHMKRMTPAYEPITVVPDPVYNSTSYKNFEKMVFLGRNISAIMEFFENSHGEYKIKDVLKYLEEKNIYLPMQRITAVCRRLCASGYLKQRYSEPYKITVKSTEWNWDNFPKHKEVTREFEVRDSLYSLA